MLFKGIDKAYWNSLLKASLLGIHMVATTFMGFALGYFLDKWLHTHPWLKMIFLFLGIAAGFKNMFQEARNIQKSDEQRNQSKDK